MKQMVRVAGLVAVAATVTACPASSGEPYTVFASVVQNGDVNAPRGDGTVRVTVNGEVVTDGTETFSGETYRQEFPIEPGQTIVVDVTSKDDEPNCDIIQDPGPTEEHLEVTRSEPEQDSSGTWRKTCTWKRPASG